MTKEIKQLEKEIEELEKEIEEFKNHPLARRKHKKDCCCDYCD